MNKIVLSIIALAFISCSPFDEEKVLYYEPELIKIIKKIDKYDHGTYNRDEIDEFTIEDVRDLGIDIIVKNYGKKNHNYSGFVEENDSLMIFIKKSESIIDKEKRIVYDFNKTPRNFGNDKIIGASYRIIQLNERWYYSETGFD